MDMSGLPDMYTRSPRADTSAGHGIYNCYVHAIATPFGKKKAAFLALQVHNLIPQSNLTPCIAYKLS